MAERLWKKGARERQDVLPEKHRVGAHEPDYPCHYQQDLYEETAGQKTDPTHQLNFDFSVRVLCKEARL